MGRWVWGDKILLETGRVVTFRFELDKVDDESLIQMQKDI